MIITLFIFSSLFQQQDPSAVTSSKCLKNILKFLALQHKARSGPIEGNKSEEEWLAKNKKLKNRTLIVLIPTEICMQSEGQCTFYLPLHRTHYSNLHKMSHLFHFHRLSDKNWNAQLFFFAHSHQIAIRYEFVLDKRWRQEIGNANFSCYQIDNENYIGKHRTWIYIKQAIKKKRNRHRQCKFILDMWWK